MPQIKGVDRLPSGGIMYRGERFPGFNRPKAAPAGDTHKKRVLAKKGDRVKVVSFGHRAYSDFTKHKDPERRAKYLAQHFDRHQCQRHRGKHRGRCVG